MSIGVSGSGLSAYQAAKEFNSKAASSGGAMNPASIDTASKRAISTRSQDALRKASEVKDRVTISDQAKEFLAEQRLARAKEKAAEPDLIKEHQYVMAHRVDPMEVHRAEAARKVDFVEVHQDQMEQKAKVIAREKMRAINANREAKLEARREQPTRAEVVAERRQKVNSPDQLRGQIKAKAANQKREKAVEKIGHAATNDDRKTEAAKSNAKYAQRTKEIRKTETKEKVQYAHMDRKA